MNTRLARTPHLATLHNVGVKTPRGNVAQCRKPHQMSTASQFGTPRKNCVRHCSTSLQIFVYARITQERGLPATYAYGLNAVG